MRERTTTEILLNDQLLSDLILFQDCLSSSTKDTRLLEIAPSIWTELLYAFLQNNEIKPSLCYKIGRSSTENYFKKFHYFLISYPEGLELAKKNINFNLLCEKRLLKFFESLRVDTVIIKIEKKQCSIFEYFLKKAETELNLRSDKNMDKLGLMPCFDNFRSCYIKHNVNIGCSVSKLERWLELAKKNKLEKFSDIVDHAQIFPDSQIAFVLEKQFFFPTIKKSKFRKWLLGLTPLHKDLIDLTHEYYHRYDM